MFTSINRSALFVSAGAFALVAMAGMARATINIPQPQLTIDDTNPNETITISANGFVLVQANGLPVLPGQSQTFPEQGPISIAATWLVTATTANPPHSRTIYLMEPGLAGAAPQVSDIFYYNVSYGLGDGPLANVPVGRLEGRFVSDSDTGHFDHTLPPGVDPKDLFFETLDGVTLHEGNLTMYIKSDVPAPGAGALVAMGTLIAARRRR